MVNYYANKKWTCLATNPFLTKLR